jgi:hypothetical protein
VEDVVIRTFSPFLELLIYLHIFPELNHHGFSLGKVESDIATSDLPFLSLPDALL